MNSPTALTSFYRQQAKTKRQDMKSLDQNLSMTSFIGTRLTSSLVCVHCIIYKRTAVFAWLVEYTKWLSKILRSPWLIPDRRTKTWKRNHIRCKPSDQLRIVNVHQKKLSTSTIMCKTSHRYWSEYQAISWSKLSLYWGAHSVIFICSQQKNYFSSFFLNIRNLCQVPITSVASISSQINWS